MAHTIVFHFIKVSKRLQNALGLKNDAYNLSHSEASALLIIDAKKETSQIDIALKLHLKPASIVSLIDELEKLKLVKREAAKQDRRRYQIKLTEKGHEEVKKIRVQTKNIEEAIKNRLTENEISTLSSILEKLSDDVELNLENISGKEVKNEIPGAKQHVAS